MTAPIQALGDRRGRWAEHYQLRPSSSRCWPGCLRWLVNRRCLRYHPNRVCDGCLDYPVADHSSHWLTPNGHRLWVTQPYALHLAELAAAAYRFGLHLAVLPPGHGWWCPATYWVVMSNGAMPEHCYRYLADAPGAGGAIDRERIRE